ncbi:MULTISPECIES: AI-2E family transporter [Sutcliffiella]|uniref:AI-2E family transporter n=1 Tax=Sutcliffiella cohnii TaxID=33932 RepID=A0A223KN14_9BACI|nr:MULTISPECIES: AI-2E family transporter [Sutcliffiella]AST90786.1 AI-2E family transporter [Sutcliffiella cohnii]MED4017928.1 AI-2E family transporter [Sutcliffiella cohnii]WBL16571.1 AI-2E family transporter [Sutcliffiella sp. NC1]
MYYKIMQVGSVILLLFAIIYLGSLVDWIFRPVIVFGQTLFVPILLAGVLFYLLRPLVHILSKKMPRGIAILLVYIGLVGLGVGLFSFIGPELQRQFTNLINSMPVIVKELQVLLLTIQENDLIQRFGLEDAFEWKDRIEQIVVIASGLVGDLVTNTISVIGTIFNTLLLFIIVPFILFYLLKEGERLPHFVLNFISKDKQQKVRPILTNMDETLSNYIQGVLIVCSFVGILYYVGFSIIGLEYALVLAIFGMVTNVIPYVGPWIGAIPSFIVALLHSPMQAILVLIIVVVIQQIESIFVQPQIIGKRMSIHPVTVMILVLVAGRFIGVVGMILVIPTYAVAKVIATHLYSLWKVRKEEQENLIK